MNRAALLKNPSCIRASERTPKHVWRRGAAKGRGDAQKLVAKLAREGLCKDAVIIMRKRARLRHPLEAPEVEEAKRVQVTSPKIKRKQLRRKLCDNISIITRFHQYLFLFFRSVHYNPKAFQTLRKTSPNHEICLEII